MKKFLIIVLIFLSVSAFAEYPEKNRFYGTVKDLQWAHNSNTLALLFQDNNKNNFIYIFKTKPFSVYQKIYISDKYDPQEIAWNSSDKRIIFSSRKGKTDSLYQLKLQTRNISVFLEKEPKIGYIRNILFSKNSLWSITWEVNESIDIFIYHENQLLTSTNTQGQYIEAINWQEESLYVRTGINSGNIFSGKPGTTGREMKTYALNPYKQTANLSNKYFKDLLNTSWDGNFYINIIQDIYITLFELWLY